MALQGAIGGGGGSVASTGVGTTLGGLGTSFKTLFSGAPNAPIKRAVVDLPKRGDYGAPATAPTVTDPNRANYGTPDTKGLSAAAGVANRAQFGFNNPTRTSAFKGLMGLAQEQTGQQEAERSRQASDAAQRRGYAGGFEDEARQANQDKMNALAQAGFQAGDAIRTQEGEQYGRAIGAFTQLQSSYNEAKSAGDIAFASDLTKTHMENAENMLKTAGLNMDQQQAFAGALNEAKMTQAKLDQDFNNSLIDNNRYIQGQQQIAAQLLAQQMALQEKQREFDTSSTEQKREFDLNLKANPNTALRTFADPRYAGPNGRRDLANKGSVFTGLS